jgi:PAS domain S-box-containing protein
MSLTTRLRLFIILLMVPVITALSLLHLYYLGAAAFDDVRRRAEMHAQQAKWFMNQRIRERMASQPAPGSLEELVANDPEIAYFLETWAANSQVIIEILVADDHGRILADSIPSRKGSRVYALPDFTQWVQKNPWGRLREVFWERRDYEFTLPLGVGGQRVFTLKVILSSVFLRDMLFPQVRSIGLIFLGALLLSMVLAVVVSNLALRPLARISQTLDRISRGEFPQQDPVSESTAREFAAVQSKLNLLGQQVRGARQDASQLRSNVEQLLENLEEVVLLFDAQDRLVMAGRAAERLLGRGRWELVGRGMSELFPPSSALGVAIVHAIELRQPLKDLALTLERDGAKLRLLVNVEMLEAFPGHQRIGTLVTLRDAETRRQIQSQLDVSARLAAISRLTGGVAHEIKNPLQAITVHLELLRSRLAGETGVVAPEIETIAREIQRLDRVVKTFLDFTRPIELKMRDLEMAGLAREVAALVGPSAGQQGVRIELDAEPGGILVHGDPDLLKQAILNVVVNGVESMKSGGRLGIELRQEGGECRLSISDEGVGIPPEIREKIFNLYYSTKGKGSGIGLAMTYRVVQLHNGTIDLTSEVGKGTTFLLRFPAIGKDPLG